MTQLSTSGSPKGGTFLHFVEDENRPVVAAVVAALRRSVLTCSVGAEEVGGSGMEIGWPTDVRHLSHVTFDRFHGFLGLPVEFEPELPRRVPSASVRIFGVSAKSMQCSFDNRGNSVPTILLLMQKHLYSHGGLQAEGIFRINAENSQEELVRNQLNKGIIPQGIDMHCLAGLIKAWFRELPAGILDSLTPEQVMCCNTEEECCELVKTLPPTESALLDWAINLMADVVQYEHLNKMNARNIAMVFAPNMTQMSDPLTALIHAVQVMNFLKTLIVKALREREESAAAVREMSYFSRSPGDEDRHSTQKKQEGQRHILAKLLSVKDRSDSDLDESFRSLKSKCNGEEEHELTCWEDEAEKCETRNVQECKVGDAEKFVSRMSFREGVKRLCRPPDFQLNRSMKKSGGHLAAVNSGANVKEAWV